MTRRWSVWNPKALNRDVTNLELWVMFALGLGVARFFRSWWLWFAMIPVTFGIQLWRGHCGLDQWPNPHGRYYKRWLGLKDAGDYYAWLAQQLGNREPWSEWAKLEKEL